MTSIKTHFFQAIRTAKKPLSFHVSHCSVFKATPIHQHDTDKQEIWINTLPTLSAYIETHQCNMNDWYKKLYDAWTCYHLPWHQEQYQTSFIPINPHNIGWGLKFVTLKQLHNRLKEILPGEHTIHPDIGWISFEHQHLPQKLGQFVLGKRVPLFAAGLRIISILTRTQANQMMFLKDCLKGWPALLNMPSLTVQWTIIRKEARNIQLSKSHIGQSGFGQCHYLFDV